MHRRTILVGSTATLLAGCSDLTALAENGYVEQTVQDEETATFSADAGTELSVSVTVEEIAEPDEGVEVSSDAISFRLDHADDGPLEMRTIEESETFDVTIEADGEHIVTNGVAQVSIDEA